MIKELSKYETLVAESEGEANYIVDTYKKKNTKMTDIDLVFAIASALRRFHNCGIKDEIERQLNVSERTENDT